MPEISPEEAAQIFSERIREEMVRLECERQHRVAQEQQRDHYAKASALLSTAEVLQRLLRYEARLDREFNRTLDQLERWQRIRAGQPVPPPLKVSAAHEE